MKLLRFLYEYVQLLYHTFLYDILVMTLILLSSAQLATCVNDTPLSHPVFMMHDIHYKKKKERKERSSPLWSK